MKIGGKTDRVAHYKATIVKLTTNSFNYPNEILTYTRIPAYRDGMINSTPTHYTYTHGDTQVTLGRRS